MSKEIRWTRRGNIQAPPPYKKLERNAPCWCGSGRKYKSCHEAFDDRILQAA
ncbi:MAG: SEC-C domain-containing protein, partial [Butyrivibrio sp.]|nr:SEC-C domain-containing protein [Butyrivibrio sp.]